jgi:hypothetical protein
MVRWPATWWIALRLFAAVAACAQLGGAPDKVGGEPDKTCAWDAFELLSDADKLEKIASCTPERQLNLYMGWWLSTRPPSSLLLDSVASLGPRVLPFVVARFKATRDGLTKTVMFEVLRWMQLKRYYDVRADSALLDELEQSVAAMPDSWERDEAKLDMFELRTGQRPPSPKLASKPRRVPIFTREENAQRVANLLKMMSDTSDKEKAGLFTAFFNLRDVQHYDVSSDPEVMGRLEAVCAGIKHAASKKLALQYLDALRTGAPEPDEPRPRRKPGPLAIP